jgi:hypothetical protein
MFSYVSLEQPVPQDHPLRAVRKLTDKDFRGQSRSNKTHESTTDADARLYKKSYGQESKLSYLCHGLVENRNGLIAAAMVTHVDGYAERDAALLMLQQKQFGRSRRITVVRTRLTTRRISCARCVS